MTYVTRYKASTDPELNAVIEIVKYFCGSEL